MKKSIFAIAMAAFAFLFVNSRQLSMQAAHAADCSVSPVKAGETQRGATCD